MCLLASDFLSYLFTAGAKTPTHDWGQKFHCDLEQRIWVTAALLMVLFTR